MILLNYPGSATFNGAVTATSSKRAGGNTSRADRPAEQPSTEIVDETSPAYFTSNEGSRIFSDDFEGGDDSQWSTSAP